VFRRLVPPDQIEAASNITAENLSKKEKIIRELEQCFPNDPRVYCLKGLVYRGKRDLVSMVESLTPGLAKLEEFNVFASNNLEIEMRFMLGAVLIEQ
jgi:hypothetical protein